MSLARALMAAAVFMVAVPASEAQGPVRLLDVPYVPQSEALCGGAAAAMVMRYWNEPDVYAERFAHLVDPAAGGIRGEDLLRALREEGWRANAFRGDRAIVARHLSDGRPVIALIEDRPGLFHYVVVVAWSAGRVIAHDPARAPFRLYRQEAFNDAWSRSDFWTLLAVPDGNVSSGADDLATAAPVPTSPGPGPCDSMVSEGVRLAGIGDLDQARALLELATETCSGDAAPRRELAGVHVLRHDWGAAVDLARDALDRDPADAHAARILGTGLFLQDEAAGALAAWNTIGEPRIDLVSVTGLERIRHQVVAGLLQLEARAVLTPEALGTARRRLAELPGASFTRVRYAPRDGGRADVEAVVVERPLAPSGLVPLAALAARSLIDREVRVTLANPTGHGEALAGSWRWWTRRPRAAVAFTTPAPAWGPGTVWRLEAAFDQQTYGVGAGVEERRRGGSFAAADWFSERWRWELGTGIDRWRGLGTSVALNAALARHSSGDRWIATARASLHGGAVETGTLSVGLRWRSAAEQEGVVWHGRTGFEFAGETAPYALWPGAGTGHAREALLRAHPLLDDGFVRGGVFGRRLAHGGIELRRWVRPSSRPWRFAPALFVDVAHAARTDRAFDSRLHVDAGAGLRLGVPSGAIRIDVGWGLRDGATAVSAGWTR